VEVGVSATQTSTQTFSIASIPADGVGKEVVSAGRGVLEALAENSNGKFAFEWTEFPWGSEYYAKTGLMMYPKGLETLPDRAEESLDKKL
jgi:tartrate dehydrogenase/decarboxylase / D-malate dehydrogenase